MVQVIALVNNEYSSIRNELVFLDNSVNKKNCVQIILKTVEKLLSFQEASCVKPYNILSHSRNFHEIDSLYLLFLPWLAFDECDWTG